MHDLDRCTQWAKEPPTGGSSSPRRSRPSSRPTVRRGSGRPSRRPRRGFARPWPPRRGSGVGAPPPPAAPVAGRKRRVRGGAAPRQPPAGDARSVATRSKRNVRGSNHGRRSRKFNQDCTIRHSCPWAGPCWTVPREREKRVERRESRRSEMTPSGAVSWGLPLGEPTIRRTSKTGRPSDNRVGGGVPAGCSRLLGVDGPFVRELNFVNRGYRLLGDLE